MAIALLATSFAMSSCNSAAEKVSDAKEEVQEAQQDLNEANQNYAEQYSKFKIETDAKISANDQMIADLKTYSNAKKKEAKMEYDNAIMEMEQKNNEMKAKMENYKEEGNDNWNAFKEEFNHDMNEIGESLKSLTEKNTK